MMNRSVPKVLTIAGSDSGGGAGVQGDLKTFEAFHVYGLTVVTAITAQNTRGVAQVYDIPAAVAARQIDVVAEDIAIDAVKTGMLANPEIIEVVADRIRKHRLTNVVVDPVMRAKSGDRLLVEEAEAMVEDLLLPLARVVTPNLPEAEWLSGIRIRSIQEMRRAAELIQAKGSRAVLIKGGHLDVGHEAIDILLDGDEVFEISATRIDVPGGVHGTGCAYSSGIASGLAKGLSLVESVNEAKSYITEAIRQRFIVGTGHPVLNHAWKCSKEKI